MNKYTVKHLLWGSTLNMYLLKKGNINDIVNITIPITDKLKHVPISPQYRTIKLYTLHFSFLDVEECKDT